MNILGFSITLLWGVSSGNIPGVGYGTVVSLIILFFLLICSALISGSETAFFSLSPIERGAILAADTGADKYVHRLLEKPKMLLATILISNNFVNVGIVMLSTYFFSHVFDFSFNPAWGFVIQVVCVTSVLLLLGEIMPKIMANRQALIFSRLMARPLIVIRYLFFPLSKLLVKSTSIIDKRMMKRSREVSMEEISEAIDLTVDENKRSEEHKILKGIVKFRDIDVTGIMCPRVDVAAVDASITFEKLWDFVTTSGHSRIPVYKDNFDAIVGVLYIKDLLPYINGEAIDDWVTLCRPAFFIPENKKINDLLQEFREKNIHLAVVVDEYGGTSGIVTLEDVIEEIVGEIGDEFDDIGDGVRYTRIDEHTFVFEGKTLLNDFCRIVNIEERYFDDARGESDTLAGLMLEMEGDIPERGRELVYKNFEFKIEESDARRVRKVRVVVR